MLPRSRRQPRIGAVSNLASMIISIPFRRIRLLLPKFRSASGGYELTLVSAVHGSRTVRGAGEADRAEERGSGGAPSFGRSGVSACDVWVKIGNATNHTPVHLHTHTAQHV